MKRSLLSLLALVSAVAAAGAPDLSPAKWKAEARAGAEALAQSHVPPAAGVIEGKSGIVSATMSPIAVQAGLEALRQGGNAADAAATTALTQITTALGSYVSYAGLMQLTYFEAKTGRVYCMNAGWNTYRGETDPHSIPTTDPAEGLQGRKTMVPGFMAGLEAMHARFGTFPFAELFAPAIWYSENGVVLSPLHASFFGMRHHVLSRTPEGRAFLHQGASDRLPTAGDRFVQADLAKTLRAVAKEGARYMYTGDWAKAFVAAVQREGGKATLADLAAYAPTWEEPLATDFAGHTVHAAGRSSEGGYQILQILNLLEELETSKRGPYWEDPQTLIDLTRAQQFAAAGTYLHSAVAASVAAQKITLTEQDRAGRRYAKAAVPLLDLTFNPPTPASDPKHSDAVVVIDQWGNVAAMVHTINTVLWGSSGIVVGGIPLSDAAAIQKPRLLNLPPGTRVPNEMTPLIATKAGKPALAIACIGSSLVPETARLLLSTLGQNVEARGAMAAPPLLLNYDYTKRATILVPEKGYTPALLDGLKQKGITIDTRPQQEATHLKGTAVIGLVPSGSASRQTVETPTVSSFAAGH